MPDLQNCLKKLSRSGNYLADGSETQKLRDDRSFCEHFGRPKRQDSSSSCRACRCSRSRRSNRSCRRSPGCRRNRASIVLHFAAHGTIHSPIARGWDCLVVLRVHSVNQIHLHWQNASNVIWRATSVNAAS